MENVVKAMYPDCGENQDAPNGCFERYVKDRLSNMKDHNICHLVIETFEESHDEVFKRISEEYNQLTKHVFWWNVRSKNIGTVKDKYVYSIDLFLKHDRSFVNRP